MATSVREQVIAAFYSVVNTALPVALPGALVERNRSRAVPKGEDAYIVLFDGPQIILSDDTCSSRYETAIDVEGTARAASDALLGPAINNLWAETVAAALADHTLGGISIDVREGSLQDVYIDDEASKPTGMFAMTFTIEFSTAGGDPFTLGS